MKDNVQVYLHSISFLNVASDSPEAWQVLFQDPATPIMAGIINLHYDLMFVLWMIVRTVILFYCWFVNSLGVKVDAVLGRLNQAALFINRAGMFFGQCSEICGVNHGFIPIIVHAVTQGEFLAWILGMFFLLELS